MNRSIYALLALLLLTAFASPARAEATPGYYRFPALHGDTIVFVAEGDLWTVDVEGGVARRLTSHPGEESNPVISPDGKTVAFAAEYEGPIEAYAMPLEGGRPRRLTVDTEPSIPVAWTPSGKLVYSTQHYSTLPATQLVAVDLESNKIERIPLTQASDASIDPDGTIYFVRPRFHEQQVKRYRGGTARGIWKFERNAKEAVKLTADLKGECHSPAWYDGRIYFATDVDGTMNIWSMDADGEDRRQHSDHSGWDVKSPSLHDGRIVYQVGADLWLLDVKTNVQRKIPITLASDFDHLREKWVSRPMAELSSAHLHPEGKSVALTSRGRLFVAPVGEGRIVQASRKPGVRFRDAGFLPDGERVLAVSDESDEYEFWTLSARGLGDAKQITRDGSVLKWKGVASPDSKHLAYADKHNDFWIVDLADKSQTLVSDNREGIRDFAWSPDGRWLAYCQTADNTYVQIKIYSLKSKQSVDLTSARVNSVSPAWSPDGDWLYFLSDRSLASIVPGPWGPRQPEPYFDRPMKLYRTALRPGLRSPFQEEDELSRRDDDDNDDKNGDAKKGKRQEKEDDDRDDDEAADDAESNDEKKSSPADDDSKANEKSGDNSLAPIEIELEGIKRRVKEVPVSRGNLSDLACNRKALFWIDRGAGGRSDASLMTLEIGSDDSRPKRFAGDVGSFELSANGQKLLVSQGGELYVVDAEPKEGARLADGRVDLSGWNYSIDVREDWRQMFVDAWRLHRDYFYDGKMHGVNWPEVRRKYEPLVDRVTSREELSDLIGQMVGELSVLHTAVRGGDTRKGRDRVSVPTLGARLIRDENAGGYRIDYIYQSDPDYPDELSPLADPDLDVEVGDVLLEINGEPTLAQSDPHLLLRAREGRQVLLRLRDGDSGDEREAIVKPIGDEAALRYRDWEYSRRLRVEQQGDGKLGYVHLREMKADDLAQWYRHFYPVFDRQGLIIDVRNNRGGNIDSIILEKLLRKAWFYWQARTGKPYWNMHYAFRGHLTVLCDEHTASDGEAFAEGFRRLGLGKVIGMRTWGGEIWLSGSNTLSDGGVATAAEKGVYGPEREWLIEGHGVEPDIVVDNAPHATFKGKDAQLDAAIKHLLEEIEMNPRPVPEPPEYPDKSFDYP